MPIVLVSITMGTILDLMSLLTAPSVPEASTAIFRGPFDNVHHSWSFKTTLDTYADKVQAINPNMKLCVTEFGWASSEGYDSYPTGFEFAQDNTLQEQADYIVQAFQQMAPRMMSG